MIITFHRWANRGSCLLQGMRASTVLRAATLMLAITAGGCASTGKWVAVRETPENPLSGTLGLLTRQGPKPTERTIQLLRRYDMEKGLHEESSVLLTRLDRIDEQQPSREHLYAMAELAYTGAKRAEQSKKHDRALELFGSSVVYAYRYLFDPRYETVSNPYDPQFRRACDLYNAALEGTLRIVQSQEEIKPGTTRIIQTANHDCLLEIQLISNGWHDEDFDRFEFVSDYEVQGLKNHYHSYGLGVPMIAIRKQHANADPREQFYPAELSFPITAFLRMKPDEDTRDRTIQLASHDGSEGKGTTDDQTQGAQMQGTQSALETVRRHRLRAVLELRDPLDCSSVEVAGTEIPLETDLSTPLAFFLSQPAFDDTRLSTLGLLKPDKANKLTGLYMLEPFRSDKIPVVMVHGLWSSPATWMEMFNDLHNDPWVRAHYQFWFYLYPSGQPFWFSATRMREDLSTMRLALDPHRQFPALDQTVLVGHSMGGLVSKLQSVDSGNRFWGILSERPFDELQADPEVKQAMGRTFFFDPNPSIGRVITIGTPHRGSDFSNDFTRWLGGKLIRIPNMILQGRNQLVARNPNYFRPSAPLDVHTSIDSLSPKSPLLPVLLTAPSGPWMKYHNIMGQAPQEGFTGWLMPDDGDGVVSLASAQVDNAQSQIMVPADHTSVHRHPQSILEVRRILRRHVEELRQFPYGIHDSGGPARQATSVRQATLPAVLSPATVEK